MIKDKYDYIEYSDLNQDMQMVADLVGMVVIREMCRRLGKLQIYIPSFQRIRPAVQRLIDSNKNVSARELSLKYDLSEIFIKRLRSENDK